MRDTECFILYDSIMKWKILKINWGEAYNVKVWDIVELELLKPPYDIIWKYTTKSTVWNNNWKPIFKEDDIEIIE